MTSLDIIVLGLSITSSWGNGHATNFRGLQRALTERGHRVTFLERDVPWYAAARDLPRPPWGRTELYRSLDDLEQRFRDDVAHADLVILGSFVPEGIRVGEWVTETAAGVTAFYDIDTPVTLAAVASGTCEYLDTDLMAAFDVYLSFTGGPTLELLHERYQVRRPMAFYCLVDPEVYRPLDRSIRWDLGYLGTYSPDRQAGLDRLLVETARRRSDLRFVVAGPQYPDDLEWPTNVERIDHLAPGDHAEFYAAQRATLNLTRSDMTAAGWSPSVRLFEAGACGVPVISDRWDGLDSFFSPDKEILVADSTSDVERALAALNGPRRRQVGSAARARVLSDHTAAHRAMQLEHLMVSVGAGARSLAREER